MRLTRMAALETRYAKTADGVHIAYQVVGDGPVDMVFVMGWVTKRILPRHPSWMPSPWFGDRVGSCSPTRRS